jgi:hypothetical protein
MVNPCRLPVLLPALSRVDLNAAPSRCTAVYLWWDSYLTRGARQGPSTGRNANGVTSSSSASAASKRFRGPAARYAKRAACYRAEPVLAATVPGRRGFTGQALVEGNLACQCLDLLPAGLVGPALGQGLLVPLLLLLPRLLADLADQ